MLQMVGFWENFPWEVALALAEAALVFLFIRTVRKILLRRIDPSKEIGRQIGRLTRYWPIVLGLYLFLVNFQRLPSLFRYTYTVLDFYLYLTATLVMIQISIWIIRRFLDEKEIAAPMSQSVYNGIHGLFFLLGTLLFFRQIGFPITPFLAILGVGGFAVALAFQDTLSDTAAGFHLLSERSLRIGDRIRLHSGEEGIVVDIFWKTTRIQSPSGQIYLVPNRTVARTILTTYSREELWNSEKIRQWAEKHFSESKLILVSNREPYVHRWFHEEIRCERPAGGLTAALDPVMQATQGLWVAWGSGDADRDAADQAGKVAVPPHHPTYLLKRIWLTEKEIQHYYYGFSNRFFWPLFHKAMDKVQFLEEDWAAYKEVNRRFAEGVLSETDGKHPVIWIQDYHLAYAPLILRERAPQATLSLFWHIPWPSYDVFRVAPCRRELMEALLCCDLIGFQTDLYRDHFLECARKMFDLPIDASQSSIAYRGRNISVKTFPISIDAEAWTRLASAPQAMEEIKGLRKRLGVGSEGFIGIGVDRLEYTKALVERFTALDLFFTRYPQFSQKFTFIQIASPSRVEMADYQAYAELLDKTARTINEKHGRNGWNPIDYRPIHIHPETLAIYYRGADLAIISSFADGMNLVAKEFIASQINEQGVLLLSELAGASEEVKGAFLINPYDVEGLAEAIKTALGMTGSIKQVLMQQMREQVRVDNVYRWMGEMLQEMDRIRNKGN
jgi:trehalose 6-phosphate synthase